jgi:cell division transport system ATP-binding protein
LSLPEFDVIQFHNVYLTYQRDVTALHNVSFSIEKGAFVFLAGPSGAGKSTLLRLLYAGLMPTKGQVIIDGQNVTRMSHHQIALLRRQIGVVFQDFKLLPNRTVFENVAITLEVLGWGKKDIGRKVYHMLKQMGLEHKINSTPLRLSGGEQQRVALARALVNDPRILLADEPTGNLDSRTTAEIMDLLAGLNQSQGMTQLVVTHNPQVAGVARRVITLRDGQIQSDVAFDSVYEHDLIELKHSLLGRALLAGEALPNDLPELQAAAPALRQLLERV